MDLNVNKRAQLICAWTAPPYIALFLIGLLIAGLLPPPSPALGPEQIADFFTGNTNGIRIGCIIIMASEGLWALFISGITVQLRRIEGRHSPLSFAQLGLGMLAVLLTIIPLCFVEVAAFRPGQRSPEVIQMLSDVCFIPLIGAYFTAVAQWICIAIVILMDKRVEPIFPRWAGYANLWIATGTVLSTGLFFLKTGPFAWNGLISFWLIATLFFGWVAMMVPLMIKAINRQAAGTDEPDSEIVELAARVAGLMRSDAPAEVAVAK